MKLLIVEDNEKLRRALGDGLRHEGFIVDLAADGVEALAFKRNNSYDVIVLDLMLPKIDGLTFLKNIRRHHADDHVIILSARDEVEDRVRGIDSGADDYLVKPFSFDELCARIRAIGRRNSVARSMVREVGQLSIDIGNRQVFVASKLIPLTPKEYDLLETLSRRLGRILSKRQLNVLVHDSNSIVTDNVIEVLVSSLRRKLKAHTGSSLIETRHGFGYVIEQQSE